MSGRPASGLSRVISALLVVIGAALVYWANRRDLDRWLAGDRSLSLELGAAIIFLVLMAGALCVAAVREIRLRRRD